jgi:hypothetical protein
VVDADSPLLHFLSKVMVLDVEMFGKGFVDSELEEPSPPSCDLVDLNSSCEGHDGLTGGVVNANCGGLYDGVPCAALVRVAG